MAFAAVISFRHSTSQLASQLVVEPRDLQFKKFLYPSFVRLIRFQQETVSPFPCVFLLRFRRADARLLRGIYDMFWGLSGRRPATLRFVYMYRRRVQEQYIHIYVNMWYTVFDGYGSTQYEQIHFRSKLKDGSLYSLQLSLYLQLVESAKIPVVNGTYRLNGYNREGQGIFDRRHKSHNEHKKITKQKQLLLLCPTQTRGKRQENYPCIVQDYRRRYEILQLMSTLAKKYL